jgi:hypothetical protein
VKPSVEEIRTLGKPRREASFLHGRVAVRVWVHTNGAGDCHRPASRRRQQHPAVQALLRTGWRGWRRAILAPLPDDLLRSRSRSIQSDRGEPGRRPTRLAVGSGGMENVARSAAGLASGQTQLLAPGYARRRAWTIVLLAFFIWCSLAAAVLVTLFNHRRSATESPTVDLSAERGTVFYQGPNNAGQVRVRDSLAVEEGSIVEAGEGGHAALRLFEGSTISLLPKSRLQLATLRVGRFNASLTQASLVLLEGAARIDVAGGLPSGRDLRVTTSHGSVNLSQGSYLVWVQDGRARVISYRGRAEVESNEVIVRLGDGQRSVMSADGPPRGPLPVLENLVLNGDFIRQLQGWTMLDRGEPGRPDIGGNRRLVEESIAGRQVQALQIVRDSPKDAWNETGIVQEINQDVSAFRNVTMTAWVKVNFASLSGGGYLGSEYPMMFRVNYTDERGGRPGWTHGFYYANPENRPTTNGEIIARGEWYPFLARLADLPERPAFIQSIEVLSAGHDFDAVVADVRLTVE